MKTITVHSPAGHDIDVNFDEQGAIRIRHPGIDATRFLALQAGDSRQGEADIQDKNPRGSLATNETLIREITSRLGGYVVRDGELINIGADETALIVNAVIEAGGTVPHWPAD